MREEKNESGQPGEEPLKGWREQFGLPSGGGDKLPQEEEEEEDPQMMEVMMKGRLMRRKETRLMKTLSL